MWYWIFKSIFFIILKLFFGLKVEGIENLPKKTNFIVVANHTSFMDGVVLGAAIPQKVHWITLRQLYSISWLEWFFNRIEAIPSGNSSEKAMTLVMQNKNVGLFPQGGISRNGELRDFRRGAALLAMRTGRPIVPCAILGSYRALPFGRRFPRFVPIKVRIGKPGFLLKEFDDFIDDVAMQDGLLKIRNTLKEMLYAG